MALCVTRYRNFARPKAGQKQRPGGGSYEEMTNRQQRALVRVYDSWAAKVRKELRQAADAGASILEQGAILEKHLPLLELALEEETRKGVLRAARVAAGSRVDSPVVQRIVQSEVRKIGEAVRTALIPNIADKLFPAIAAGNAFIAAQLLTDFNAVRVLPAQYAGGAWVAIFEVNKGLGRQREIERIAAGEAIEPVRWVPDPNAEHCSASTGYYGCLDLAKEYPGGWNSLPTVPAGMVTCRGNCRCHLEVYRNGEWRRGVYDD